MARRRMLELTHVQRQELLDHRDPDPQPDVRERCAAMVTMADGQTAHAVAHQGLLKRRDSDTVYGWLVHYQRAGLPGLLARQPSGRRRGGP